MAATEIRSNVNEEVLRWVRDVQIAEVNNDAIKSRWNTLLTEILGLTEQNVQLTIDNLSEHLPQRSNRPNYGRIMYKLFLFLSELDYSKKQGMTNAYSNAVACVSKQPDLLNEAFILYNEQRNIPSNKKFINAMKNLPFKGKYTYWDYYRQNHSNKLYPSKLSIVNKERYSTISHQAYYEKSLMPIRQSLLHRM